MERIPVFYACDDNFVKYTVVSLYSMIANADPEKRYDVHILHTGLSSKMREVLKALENSAFRISFDDVSEWMKSVAHRLPLRDYYSKTTYYRLLIAEMYPEYDKAVYIDSDTVVCGDISEFYEPDIGDAYLGACHEQAMIQVDEYGEYVEKVLGISRYNYFNAGVLLINCDRFRIGFVLDKFLQYLHTYDFVVTQDEDYLNLICKDHVFWMDQRWNTEVYCNIEYPEKEAKILHYIMTAKPWHYRDCKCSDIFWKYACRTSVYPDLEKELAAYTDADRETDRLTMENLVRLAVSETKRDDNYLNRLNRASRANDRVEIVQKIEQYEREGRFDEDVENDPPGKVLLPDDIEYIKKGMISKLKTRFAFMTARRFVDSLIRSKKMIVKDIKGLEYFKGLNSGAIITCNHFNAFDSFAIQIAYDRSEQPKRTFYRIIKEGNYTSFPGFYGFLMRHCNTLPLSSDPRTMKKFMSAVGKLLRDGNFVLVYPEQSMWWNYRKPKPLKKGAYLFAAKNDVPVLPCFITMKDSDIMGEDGYFVQEYTIHIAPPIYPDKTLKGHERIDRMMEENARVWKEIYEREYAIPLTYTTEVSE